MELINSILLKAPIGDCHFYLLNQNISVTRLKLDCWFAVTQFLSLHRSVLALRVASFPAIELRARGTGLYWFSK